MTMAQVRRRAGSRRWRGFSLFGVLLGLAVAGVVVVGAVALYNQTQEAAGRSEILTLLSQLKGGVERVYAGQPNYGTGSLIATLDRRAAIPDSARVVTAGKVTIEHPFDATVEITGSGGQYTIKFNDLDDEVCATLADTYVNQTRARTGLVSIDFSGSEEEAPITVAEVTAGCAEGAAANDVTFTFG